MARRPGNSLLRRAQDETLLRYGGEARGLAELLSEAHANFKTGVKAERASAAGIQAAVREAGPQIAQAYQSAGATAAQAQSDAQSALAGLGSSADPYRAVSAREAAGAKARLGAALADATSELANRKVDAAAGAAYGVRQRGQEFAGERARIGRQRQALEGEMGTYASTTYRDLQDADAKLNLEKRKVRLSITEARETGRHNREQEGLDAGRLGEDQRHNRAVERRQAREDAKGKPKWTPSQLQDARAMWDKGKAYAHALDGKGLLEDEAAAVRGLVKKGVDVPVARGVVELVKYGGVKKGTRSRLHRDYGLKPKPLGYVNFPNAPGIVPLGPNTHG